MCTYGEFEKGFVEMLWRLKLTLTALHFSVFIWPLHYIHLLWLRSPLDLINEGFEEDEVHRIPGGCLMWMQALHLVSHRTRFLFSVTHPRLSALQLWSCGKEPFDSSRSLQPPPQAVCKPRSCRCLLVTNSKASGRRKAQMKAAGLEKRSTLDLWIFFKQHLISY